MKKWLMVTASLFIAAGLAFPLGEREKGAGRAGGTPVTLRIFRPANIVDSTKDPVMLELQKRTNTRLEIVTAPSDQCWPRLDLIMASGEDVDIIHADQSASPWQEWAREGLLNDIGALVTRKTHPYISSVITSEIFKPVKVDGRSWVIHGTHHGQDWSLFLREDWLARLGLAMPKTMEELYSVLLAFKLKDPDGNGVADTIGYQATMADVDSFGDFDPLVHGFGGSFGGFFKDFVVRNGKIIALEVQENTRDGLKFINRLFREGIVNSDFATIRDVVTANAKYLYANKAGALWTSRASEFEGNIRKTAPGARLAFVAPVLAARHTFIPTQGTAWWLVIGVPKISKHAQAAVDFIEYCNSREGRELLICGIEGRHYTSISADGVYDQNRDAWEADFDTNANGNDYPLWYGFMTTVHGYIPVDVYPRFEDAMKNVVVFVSREEATQAFNWKSMVAYGARYNEPNPLHSIILPDTVAIYSAIQRKVKAVFFLKMIVTPDPAKIDGLWQQYLSAWKNAGGEALVKAYQDYYDRNLR